MDSNEVMEYIFQTAKQQSIDVPEDYWDILNNYCKIVEQWGYRLVFKSKQGTNPDGLHADTTFHKITVTPAWAAQLVLHDTVDTRTAFMMTLGHETAHDEKTGFPLWAYVVFLPYLGFLRHVKETYCDFRAAQKVCNSDRDRFVKSIDYKIDFKKEIGEKNINDFTHPSWQKRRAYAEHFDFGESLIKQIAKDNKCSGKRIETTVINFYKGYDIKLFPPPEPINNTGDTN